jgi:predicted  nucleic acid-binding Zn-ribbon protein
VDSATETPVNQLAALQEIDRQLREKTELQRLLEKQMADLDARLLQQQSTAASTRSEKEAVDAKRREMEARLDSEGVKMKERRMRLNRVRNEKELQALRHEIEVGKEANQQLEEELLRILEVAESLTAANAEAERVLADLQTAVAAQVAEHQQRIAELEGEIVRGRAERERSIHGIDAALLRKYEQIFQRRGGTAVVEVRNGTCLGCHMNLPPQLFNELQGSRDVRTCPNCHRILFWRPERLESA